MQRVRRSTIALVAITLLTGGNASADPVIAPAADAVQFNRQSRLPNPGVEIEPSLPARPPTRSAAMGWVLVGGGAIGTATGIVFTAEGREDYAAAAFVIGGLALVTGIALLVTRRATSRAAVVSAGAAAPPFRVRF